MWIYCTSFANGRIYMLYGCLTMLDRNKIWSVVKESTEGIG